MASSSSNTKLIAFMGASGGIGLGALTRALAAGHTCIALCRTPSKLTDRFPADQFPNLKIVQGNAHDAAAVVQCLVVGTQPVDAIVSTIGGVLQFSRMTLDDPHVCEKGMSALLAAISLVRESHPSLHWRPRVAVVSTCGISQSARDVPILFVPMYKIMLRVPHEDKIAMEKLLVEGAGKCGYTYSIVRPSFLVDEAAPRREIRVGLGDAPAVGYVISRDDAGRWIYENLLDGKGVKGGMYEDTIATITW
ncbi:putative fungal specific transcription factor domain-containing protein [Daldinia childiae]|uniref:putative fungal specific transcription factor domain-containing protein n=1 Tax=Daldinia childiae TaxID=326645 RepID=UPI0014472687|nr:putative fungal specific transcription factor domain-containing protein [Daldinia childiae]KAF3065843.1 putative fungal specific transcription factor domain-containing protein [Daldinia childiae]